MEINMNVAICGLKRLRLPYITLLFYHSDAKVSMYICAKFSASFSFIVYSFH